MSRLRLPCESSEESGILKKPPREGICQRIGSSHLTASAWHLTVVINLPHCHLSELPDEVFQLTALEELRVPNNKLSSVGKLGQQVAFERSIRVLDLSWNRLVEVPEWITRAERLRDLDVSANQIGSPPGSDKMNHNAEDSLPSIGFHMRRFAAKNSALEEFPIGVCRFKDLMILELGNESARSDVLTRNEFWNSLRPDSIPGPELGQLLWLRELHLANLGLVYLPDDLSRLVNMRKMFLSGNALPEIPNCLNHMGELQVLDVSHNRLTYMPIKIACLWPSLNELYVSHNKLTHLPDDLGLLKSLHILDLSANHWHSIDLWKLGSLPNGLRKQEQSLAKHFCRRKKCRRCQVTGSISGDNNNNNEGKTSPHSVTSFEQDWNSIVVAEDTRGLVAYGHVPTPIENDVEDSCSEDSWDLVTTSASKNLLTSSDTTSTTCTSTGSTWVV